MVYQPITWPKFVEKMKAFKPDRNKSGAYEYINWYNKTDGVDLFGQQHCPCQPKIPNRLYTWKDIIFPLSGYPNEKITQLSLYYNVGEKLKRCFGLYGRHNTTTNPKRDNPPPIWGKTFGKYSGFRGKPICEVKAFDESFFTNIDLFTKICCITNNRWFDPNREIFSILWESGSCLWFCFKNQGSTSAYRAGPITEILTPGVYGCISGPCDVNNHQVDIYDPTSGKTENLIHNYGDSSGSWRADNGIFFVDSSVIATLSYPSTRFNCVMLWRITPEGYWTCNRKE